MAQVQLPFFPEDITYINNMIGVKKVDDEIFYFNAAMPIYFHNKDDYQSFRYITSQMVCLGTVKQVEIINTFKVSKESVKRWVKKYRESGGKGFFGTRKGVRKGHVLNKEALADAQGMLNQGKMAKEIGVSLEIKPDTLRKAIRDGRLTKPEYVPLNTLDAKNKSERNLSDSQALMGVATTNTIGRVTAALKKK